MKPIKLVLQLFFFVLLSFFAPKLLAQKDSAVASIAEALDTLQSNEVPANTFTIASLLSNQIDYFGQTTEKALPYVALNGTLRLKSGIYTSVTAFHLFSDSSVFSATGFTAGYEVNVAPHLSVDGSYSYTLFPKQSPFLQASSPHMASLLVTYEHFLNTAISVDYSFGKQQDFFISLNNAKELVLNKGSETEIWALTPQVNIIAGTQRFYETYLIERNNNGRGNAPQTQQETRAFSRFGLLSYNFKMPLSYNRASYLIEAAYQLSLLGKNASERAGQTNSFFTLGLYYQF